MLMPWWRPATNQLARVLHFHAEGNASLAERPGGEVEVEVAQRILTVGWPKFPEQHLAQCQHLFFMLERDEDPELNK
jgi:hypothetical protein